MEINCGLKLPKTRPKHTSMIRAISFMYAFDFATIQLAQNLFQNSYGALEITVRRKKGTSHAI